MAGKPSQVVPRNLIILSPWVAILTCGVNTNKVSGLNSMLNGYDS